MDKISQTGKGVRRRGDGAKAPPPKLKTNYLLIKIRSILCFAVCTKKSVSQSLNIWFVIHRIILTFLVYLWGIFFMKFILLS